MNFKPFFPHLFHNDKCKKSLKTSFVILFTGTHSSTRPMVPPWPVCHANSCEKLCCPPQYEDQQPVVVPGGGYNAGGGSNINCEY